MFYVSQYRALYLMTVFKITDWEVAQGKKVMREDEKKNKMNKKRDERIIELGGKMRKMSFQIMHNLFDFLLFSYTSHLYFLVLSCVLNVNWTKIKITDKNKS